MRGPRSSTSGGIRAATADDLIVIEDGAETVLSERCEPAVERQIGFAVRHQEPEIASEFKDSNEGWSARVVAAHEQLVAASWPALLVPMGAVGFLLLIVCANMANLLLARLAPATLLVWISATA